MPSFYLLGIQYDQLHIAIQQFTGFRKTVADAIRFHIGQMFAQTVQSAEIRQQLAGRFRADSVNAMDIVGCVAQKRQISGNHIGSHAEFLLNLRDSRLDPIAVLSWSQEPYIITD